MRALVLALSLLIGAFLKPRTLVYAAAGDGPGDYLLLNWTAQAVSVNSDSVNIRRAVGLTVEVNMTAVTGTTPTLDLYIQHSVDNVNWDDIAHFTQIVAGIRKQVNIATVVAGALTDHTATDGTMAANTVRQGPIGGWLRAKATIGGTTPAFTGTVRLHADGV